MSYLGPSLRRARRRSRPWQRLVAALGVSLLVNALGLRLVNVSGIAGPVKPGVVPRSVELAPLSAKQWEANRRAAPSSARSAPPLAAVPVPPPPPPPDKMNGQVVDVQPSKNSTPPKDSRFLAEHDSTVEKETRSRYARPGYENTLAKPSEPKPSAATPVEPPRPQVAAGEGGKAGVPKQGSAARKTQPSPPLRIPEQAARDRLALKLDQHGDLRLSDPRQGLHGQRGPASLGAEPTQPEQPPGEQGQAGLPGKPGPLAELNLRPSASSYDRLAGGPAPDKLDGVEEGEGTYLNTREWKYASYFNRVKQAIVQHWDPNRAMRARDPEGTRFPPQEWNTLLAVKLDDHGGLKDVVVQRSSGLDFLDNAAVVAFREGQPFVNPPPGLADGRGEIAFTFMFSYNVRLGIDQIFRGRRPGDY